MNKLILNILRKRFLIKVLVFFVSFFLYLKLSFLPRTLLYTLFSCSTEHHRTNYRVPIFSVYKMDNWVRPFVLFVFVCVWQSKQGFNRRSMSAHKTDYFDRRFEHKTHPGHHCLLISMEIDPLSPTLLLSSSIK